MIDIELFYQQPGHAQPLVKQLKFSHTLTNRDLLSTSERQRESFLPLFRWQNLIHRSNWPASLEQRLDILKTLPLCILPGLCCQST
jgi:hypothetical protein